MLHYILCCRCGTQRLWQLWWSGERSNNIPPYRLLNTRDLPQRTHRTYLSKAKAVIRILLEMDPQRRTSNQIALMEVGARDELFDSLILNLFQFFVYYNKGYTLDELKTKNVGNRSYVTVYDHIVSYAQETEAEDEFLELGN